jgi:AcrR family transcriptional regulator
MTALRAYRRPTTDGTGATRARIMAAVRELLDEGSFHEATVEDIAKRAGVSRATVYQHFGSRLGLVDAMCDTFAENPALVEIRDTVVLEDPRAALSETIARATAFWSSEESLLRHVYGLAVIDPTAAELVERQFRDRRGEMQRLVRNLDKAGALRPGMSTKRALALLLVLTSFETFEQLRRRASLSLAELTKLLQDEAAAVLLQA